MDSFYTILLVTHTILVLFMIFMVLLQKTDSDGLGGLSGGGNQFMTGRGAANFMTRTTAILAAAFMITSLTLATMASHMTGKSIVDKVPAEASSAPEAAKTTEQAPAAPAVPKPE